MCGRVIARVGSAELAQAFRGALAPVRRMIAESTSAEDLQAKILTAYQDWSVGKVGGIIESAGVAYAANRSGVHSHSSKAAGLSACLTHVGAYAGTEGHARR